jgi:branched-chain amino acid transport system ATP-binding protein
MIRHECNRAFQRSRPRARGVPPQLIVHDLTRRFGRVLAVNGLSFSVDQGEALGMVGPNGAGKSTVFDLIAGMLRPDNGSVTLVGVDITSQSAANRCRMGIGRTYQTPRPFQGLSIAENLLLAARNGGGMRKTEALIEVDRILELTGLTAERDELPASLGLLGRRLLEIGRAVATRPSVLLLDEIAAGITESEFNEVAGLISLLRSRGIAVIWVEHVFRMLAHQVDRLLVLVDGRIAMEGVPSDVFASGAFQELYMGAGDGDGT